VANCAARTGRDLTLEWNAAALRLALNGVARRPVLSGAVAAGRKAALNAVVAQKQEAAALRAGVGLGSRVAPDRAAAVAAGQEVVRRGAASNDEGADR
jgi:hypothetical protein